MPRVAVPVGHWKDGMCDCFVSILCVNYAIHIFLRDIVYLMHNKCK